jgi:hypothetical protein
VTQTRYATNENIRAVKYGTGKTLSSFTCNLSLVNGTAFISNPSVDLRQYIGFKITLNDGSKNLVGWIKAAGTEETYSEKLSNTDMETGTPPTNWSQNGSPATFERSNTQKHAGSYSLHIISDATYEGTYQGITTTIGKLNILSAWIYLVSGSYDVIHTDGSGVTLKTTGVLSTTGSWINSVLTATQTVTGGYGGPLIRARTTVSELYIDDVSYKQVLTPSATGVTIVSTQGGTTYNWASDGGINPNSSSYTATITLS